MKVVFLGIDGVLNDLTKLDEIHEDKVEKLAKIINETNAKLVISSNLGDKIKANIPIDKVVKLTDLFKKYNIEIYDYTSKYLTINEQDKWIKIMSWLIKHHLFSEDFIILDNEDFKEYDILYKRTVETTTINNQKINYGLTDKHVK